MAKQSSLGGCLAIGAFAMATGCANLSDELFDTKAASAFNIMFMVVAGGYAMDKFINGGSPAPKRQRARTHAR